MSRVLRGASPRSTVTSAASAPSAEVPVMIPRAHAYPTTSGRLTDPLRPGSSAAPLEKSLHDLSLEEEEGEEHRRRGEGRAREESAPIHDVLRLSEEREPHGERAHRLGGRQDQRVQE